MANLVYAEGPERTRMSAGEEHLFDVSHWPGNFIEFTFELRLFGSLWSLDIVMDILTIYLENLGVCPLVLGYFTGAVVWDILDTAFVQRMAEGQNGVIRTGEWQVSWKKSDRSYGVPGRRYGMNS